MGVKMKMVRTKFGASLKVALLLLPSLTYAGPAGLVDLPAQGERTVIGVWLLKQINCTRSLEKVKSEYFFVARCEGGPFGDTGLPLIKDSDDERRYHHRFHPDITYEISPDGKLIMRSGSAIDFVAEPHKTLRP